MPSASPPWLKVPLLLSAHSAGLLAMSVWPTPSRISRELAWQEASNNMRLDFLRYLVHEKIDILGEIILTLIALQVFHHFACVVKINREILLPWIQLYLNTG